MGKNKNNCNTTALAIANTTANNNTNNSKATNATSANKNKSKTYQYGKYSNRKYYNYKGIKNVTSYPDFIELCKPSQESLKEILVERLIANGYTEIITDDGYIYAKGTIPVLLTAHMDTVHKENIKDFYEYYDEENEQHILSSPQGIGGDDRCGVYMILEIIKAHKCSVLFCEDEESGGIGSSKFCKTEFINELSELKYLIELDRANKNDAVFYDCDNKDFTSFIEDNTGYKDAHGSFSDISNLSPVCKVASVNFSCGYYNAHTTSEYVIMEEMFNTIETVKKLLSVECEQFEYIEKVYTGFSRRAYGYNLDDYDYDYSYYYQRYYGGYYDDYDYGYYNRNKKKEEEEKSLYIYVYIEKSDELFLYVSNGKTKDEAFGRFFLDNPTYCYGDVYDYEFYDTKVRESGWYKF